MEEGTFSLQAFDRDSLPIIFLDTTVAGEALLHNQKRKVDKGICICLDGTLLEIAFPGRRHRGDFLWLIRVAEAQVCYPQIEPFTVRSPQISEYRDPKVPLLASIQDAEPEMSRLLEALVK